MADDQIQRELEYKLVSLDNLERFSETFEACFGSRLGKRYFDWKYVQNPIGPVVAFEAVHKGRSIASYGLIPETYSVRGEDVRVYQSMDTMTHPEYQRRGLFGKLAKMTFAHVIEKEGRLDMVGVPGAMSHGGFVTKLGWKDLKLVRTFVALREAHALVRRLRKPRSLTFKYVYEMTPELSRFLERAPSADKPITNKLTPAFFDWRVFQRPTQRSHVVQLHEGADLVGVSVFKTGFDQRAVLVYTAFVPGIDLGAYVPSVIDHIFAETHSRMLLTWEPLTAPLRSAYASCGFVVNPWNKGPMSARQPIIVRSEGQLVNGVDWYNPDNFDLQPIMQD